MKYIIYIFLLYLFLPFSSNIDLVTLLLFFIIFNEDHRFALFFSFLIGLLVDLYNPVFLGINMLVYLILTQSLLYIKKYIAQNLATIFGTFTIFYVIKVTVIHIVLTAPFAFQPVITTIIAFLPFFFILNRLAHGVWMKT
jgi:cell shape-determining protein MreD